MLSEQDKKQIAEWARAISPRMMNQLAGAIDHSQNWGPITTKKVKCKDCGEELELDVVALCCEYCEDTVAEIAANYSIDLTDCEGEDEQTEVVCEYLENNGAFVGAVTGGFVYRAF